VIIALFGPPGSGKGTQSGFLCEQFGLEHISTGDLLRAEIRSGSELGRIAERVISGGNLLSDDLVREMVREYSRRILTSGRGILLDGYPRNLRQFEDLHEILAELGAELDLAVSLDLDEEKLIERLAPRRVCRNCGASFNLVTQPPATPGRCDHCGGELFQRRDDTAEAIKKRLDEYRRQTKPLLDHLQSEGILQSVNADQSIEDIRRELMGLIEASGAEGASRSE
jgi:adenylate kinase